MWTSDIFTSLPLSQICRLCNDTTVMWCFLYTFQSVDLLFTIFVGMLCVCTSWMSHISHLSFWFHFIVNSQFTFTLTEITSSFTSKEQSGRGDEDYSSVAIFSERPFFFLSSWTLIFYLEMCDAITGWGLQQSFTIIVMNHSRLELYTEFWHKKRRTRTLHMSSVSCFGLIFPASGGMNPTHFQSFPSWTFRWSWFHFISLQIGYTVPSLVTCDSANYPLVLWLHYMYFVMIQCNSNVVCTVHVFRLLLHWQNYLWNMSRFSAWKF